MRYFNNKTLKIIKDRNSTYNKLPIFELWELVDNSWIFSGKVSAKNYKKALEEHERMQYESTFNEEYNY